MQVVILAAGMGTRLGELTSDRPKAMVSVAGKELILRAVDFAKHPSVSERIVVTGFCADELENFLKARRPDVKVVRNPHYRDGSILSIEAALPYIKEDFLILNADHIYPSSLMERLVCECRGVTAVCDFDRTLRTDDMKVKLTDRKKLSKIRKTLDDFDGGYIGITHVPASALAVYKNAVTRTRGEDGGAAPVEWALGRLAIEEDVGILDASGMKWCEVDDMEDMEWAEKTLARTKELYI